MQTIKNIDELDLDKTYTYADYLLWRFEDMVELIRGKIHKMSPAPRRKHQAISRDIGLRLYQYLYKKPCQVYFAPFDVRFPGPGNSPDTPIYTVVQPDICVVCDEKKLDDLGCIGAPDMIVEVASPSTVQLDFKDKYEIYETAGVREYWIVLPKEKSVHVFLLNNAGKFDLVDIYDQPSTVKVNIFDGLALDWDDIFRD